MLLAYRTVGYLLRAAELDGSRVAAGYVRCLALIGCRSDEIRGLDAQDVERGAGVLHIRPNRLREVPGLS